MGSHYCYFILILISSIAPLSRSAKLDDEERFYNNVQTEIEDEVKEAKVELVNQARVVEIATKNYAAAKVKQNFFKALRVLAENELERISMQDRLRQPRQDEDEEDSDGTTRRTVPLIPVVANVLKAVFGGANQTRAVNLTYHLENVSKLFFRPIGAQINGLTNLLGLTRPSTEAASPVTLAPVPGAVVTDSVTKLLKKGVQDTVSHDRPAALIVEDDNSSTTRLPTAATTATSSTNQSSSEPSYLPGVIYIDELTKDVQEGLEGLLQVMPDLFKGAREALTLLSSLREILDS